MTLPLVRDLTLTLTLDPTTPRVIRPWDRVYVTAQLIETTGQNITGLTYTVGLWPDTRTSSPMVAPTVVERVNPSQVVVRLLVNDQYMVPAAGSYRFAVRLDSGVEAQTMFVQSGGRVYVDPGDGEATPDPAGAADNGDGTASVTGLVGDNQDGTTTIADSAVDNGDGTATVTPAGTPAPPASPDVVTFTSLTSVVDNGDGTDTITY